MGVIGIYTNANGDSLEFSRQSGIRITSWGGLTSNSANIDETTVINQVGSSVTGVGIQSKPQTIEGRYKYTKERREQLLAIVLPGDKGKLRYINTDANIDVYWDVVVSSSPNISHGYYYQNFQFTVKAGYPYPRNTYKPFMEFSPLVSSFRFPRSYAVTPKWKISYREFTPLRQIVNEGPLNTGFKITLEAKDNGVVGPYIIDIDSQNIMSFPNVQMDLGDILVISTYENDKYCRLIKDGAEENVFKESTFDSVFFQMKPGINNIRYGATSNEQSLDASIEYDTIRAGV